MEKWYYENKGGAKGDGKWEGRWGWLLTGISGCWGLWGVGQKNEKMIVGVRGHVLKVAGWYYNDIKNITKKLPTFCPSDKVVL